LTVWIIYHVPISGLSGSICITYENSARNFSIFSTEKKQPLWY
jgi:hypothetical protein